MHLGLRLELTTVRKIIVATAILRNIAVEKRERLPPDEYPYEEDEMPELPGPNGNDDIRGLLIEYYFRRLV